MSGQQSPVLVQGPADTKSCEFEDLALVQRRPSRRARTTQFTSRGSDWNQPGVSIPRFSHCKRNDVISRQKRVFHNFGAASLSPRFGFIFYAPFILPCAL